MQLEDKNWSEAELHPLELVLDPENARFELYDNVSQQAIRNHLILKEDVINLAVRISETGGLLPGERIIVTKENGEFVVLEGNRRVCACQILLDKNLVHDSEILSKIPKISETTKSNLELIKAEISKTRDIGDQVVANLHAVSLRKPWSSLSIMRYAHKKLKAGKNIYEVSEDLKLPPEDVNALIVGYRIAFFCMNMPQWGVEERRTLSSEDVDYEPLLHVLRSSSVDAHFGSPFFFDTGEANLIEHPHLQKKLHKICLHALFSQFKHQEHKVTKNTTVAAYLKTNFPISKEDSQQASLFEKPSAPPSADEDKRSKQRSAKENSQMKGATANKTAYRHKTQVFCENIVCNRHDDDRLKQLTKEIRRVSNNLKDFPLSASMLLRALFEWSLMYHVKRVGKWDDLKKKHSNKNGPKPHELLKFCSNEHFNVFAEEKHRKRLKKILEDDLLDELNWNMHSDMGNYSINRLSGIAGDMRPIIKYIIHDANYE